jgi:hypothetical protein
MNVREELDKRLGAVSRMFLKEAAARVAALSRVYHSDLG